MTIPQGQLGEYSGTCRDCGFVWRAVTHEAWKGALEDHQEFTRRKRLEGLVHAEAIVNADTAEK